jgi:F-type H+-transporting ATPase subunit b
VLTAVVTYSASNLTVALRGGPAVAAEGTAEAAAPEKDLNPIFPEVKELAWGFGSFVVLALAMRLFLFRRVRDGMTRRYDRVQGDLTEAVDLTASARSDVAAYDAQVAAVRAEAQVRVESARATLESERAAKLAQTNAEIARKRAAAAAEVEAAKAEARVHVESAVADVAARAGELAAGKKPTHEAVSAAVSAAMSQGANA